MAAPRYIEPCDVRIFAGCTSIAGQLFTDALYCGKIDAIKRPVVPSTLLMNIVDTFFAIYVSPDTIPPLHYGYDKVRFLKPVYLGDSVYTVFELIDKKVKNEEDNHEEVF